MKHESNSVGRIFESAFNDVEVEEIEYDQNWGNATGYFDYATEVSLSPGEIRKTQDETNRRLILIGTRFGTVVVFDRFSGQTNGGVYVSNIPGNNELISALVPLSAIAPLGMINILGARDHITDNIGVKIEKFAKLFEEKKDE